MCALDRVFVLEPALAGFHRRHGIHPVVLERRRKRWSLLQQGFSISGFSRSSISATPSSRGGGDESISLFSGGTPPRMPLTNGNPSLAFRSPPGVSPFHLSLSQFRHIGILLKSRLRWIPRKRLYSSEFQTSSTEVSRAFPKT